jgi:hypothetical protein
MVRELCYRPPRTITGIGLHFDGACLNKPESHAGHEKDDRPDQKRYPGPPGWGLGHETDNLIPVKITDC